KTLDSGGSRLIPLARDSTTVPLPVCVPFLLLPLAAILIPLVIVLTLPFSVVQRYRAGTARREARGWVAALNVFALLLSVGFFLVSAFISNVWIPRTLP